MSVDTVRPDSTSVASGVTLHGGTPGFFESALNDDLDSSWLSANSGVLNVGFPQPTIPAGAKLAKLRLRGRSESGASGAFGYIFISDTFTIPPVYIAWLGATTTVWGEAAASSIPDPLYVSMQIQSYDTAFVNPIALYELYLDAVYAEKPELSILVIPNVDPIESTNRPYIVWFPDVDADGGAVTNSEVKIFSDAQYGAGGFDPLISEPTAHVVSTSAQSVRPAAGLPDDTYRAYVRIAQTINGAKHWSDWEYAEFEIDVPNPAQPDVASVHDNPDEGRLEIDVRPGSGGATTTDYLQLETLDWIDPHIDLSDPGLDITQEDSRWTWTPVRTLLGDGLLPAIDADHVFAQSFETDLDNWESFGAASLTRSTDWSPIGSYSAKVEGATGSFVYSTAETEEGQRWEVELIVNGVNLGDGSAVGLAGVDGDDPLTANTVGSFDSVPITADGEQRVRLELDAPEGATHVVIAFTTTDDGNGDHLYYFDCLGTPVFYDCEPIIAENHPDPDNPVVHPHIYRVRAIHTEGEGEDLLQFASFSPWVLFAGERIANDEGGYWFKSAADPSLNWKFYCRSAPSRDSDARQTAFQPLGDAPAVVISDSRGPETGAINVWVRNAEEARRLQAIVDSLAPVLIQGPTGGSWPDTWAAIGTVNDGRIVDNVMIHDKNVQLAWTEIDRPST